MAPLSIVLRLTDRLVGGFDTYGFQGDGSWKEIERLHADDLTPGEFWLGGEVVRRLDPKAQEALKAKGVHLFDNASRLLDEVAKVFPGKA
jgi:CRISPR-associated protein Cst2